MIKNIVPPQPVPPVYRERLVRIKARRFGIATFLSFLCLLVMAVLLPLSGDSVRVWLLAIGLFAMLLTGTISVYFLCTEKPSKVMVRVDTGVNDHKYVIH